MRAQGVFTITGITCLVALVVVAAGCTSDPGTVALTGTVSSQEEGQMEGVVVSARRETANFTVSVVSDAEGHYSFPRTHLVPGRYNLTTRAVGYDLVEAGSVEVPADGPGSRDLQLQETEDLAAQLSSLEWIMSMPGTTEQKELFAYQGLSCAYCHSYERIVRSRFTAEQFAETIPRMFTYFNDGTALNDDNSRGRAQLFPHRTPAIMDAPSELAQYLATVNLSGGKATWSYELKTLPRPTGQATRVIITQWDMPRADTVPHDFAMAPDGTPWYADQSRMYIGKLDPDTNTFTEYSMPPLPEGFVGGMSDIDVDHDGNVWFPATQGVEREWAASIFQANECHFGTPTRFNPVTEEFTVIDDPSKECLQFVGVGPDGKVWMNNVQTMVRIDPTTEEVDGIFPFANTPDGAPPGAVGYQLVVNSKGDAYISDFSGSRVIGVNGETGEVKYWPTPDPGVLPRRGQMDSEDRYWFAEYGGDKITRFDTRTEEFTQWPLPYKFTTPYAASAPDSQGRVYASSNMSERVLRLDPETGEGIEYQMPTNFDSKKILYDPTDPDTVWMANTREGRLIRLEPLD